MRLYITRHGQSQGNVSGGGEPDPELTELGFLQARYLGERLSKQKLDCIISSPLVRAVATANEIAIRQPDGPAPVELLPDLMEKGTLPGYAGFPFEELKKACPSAVPCEIPSPTGGGMALRPEDDILALARAYTVIGYVRRRFCDDENVLLVAHGSFNTSLIAAALRTSLPDHFGYSQTNAGLTLVNYVREDGQIKTKLAFLNDLSHLFKHNLFTDRI